MGAVAVTEQAIIHEAHERGFENSDRKRHEGNTAAVESYGVSSKRTT